MADPNAAPDLNPFAQFDRSDAPEPDPVPQASAQAKPSVNPFAQFDRSDEPEASPQSSATGAFAREAARGALPALGSIPAMGAGAELGGAAGAAFGGPFAWATGPAGALIGGGIGAIGGAAAVGKLQDYALKMVPDSWRDALGLTDRQQQIDNEQYPKSSFLGGVAPYALTMRPWATAAEKAAAKALPENATALQRIMTNPATARIFGGAAMGGMQLGQEAVSNEGEGINWNRVAIATGFGLVFNRPTRFGERITELGARPARTLAEAAGFKVGGAGITENVFQGAHAQDPSAEMTAQQAVRDEQAVLGTVPPVTPDIHARARETHRELFDQYDSLRSSEDVFRDWAGKVTDPAEAEVVKNHLAYLQGKVQELTPKVQAAYRRVAEHTEAPTVEPPGAPARYPSLAAMIADQGSEVTPAAPAGPPGTPPEPGAESQTVPTRTIEQQRDFISQDVSRQLTAAGRPPAEAQAAGALVAARYEARASRFGGALGTPEELYRREGAAIRGAGPEKAGPATPSVPAPPIAPEDQAKQQNIDTSKDVVSGANSSKDPNGPVYIDKRIPQLSPTLKDQAGNPVNLWNSLQLHERVEADEMAKGKTYDEAHVVATAAEKELARRAGYDFDAYTKEMDGFLSGIEHEKAENPPTDAHVDPEAAIGHHRSENKQPSMSHLPAVSEFEKSGMIENAEAYKDAAKARREKSSGSGVKVFTSAAAEARANSTTVKEANAKRAALVAEHGARFDEADHGIDASDISKEDRVAAIQAMIELHMEPAEALEYAVMKAEREAGHIVDDKARLAAEGIIRSEEHGADVTEIPFDTGEHAAGAGEEGQRSDAQDNAATGGAARFAGARFPEEVEFYQRGGKERDLLGEREKEGQQQIPGADRISQAELVQRRANQPLKPTVAQKPADEGLFGDSAAQKELFQEAPVKYDPLEMARNGELTADRAVEISKELKDEQDAAEDKIFGKEIADRWRKLHRQSDRAWDSGYRDNEAREYDRQIAEIEAAANLSKEDEDHLNGIGWAAHSSPDAWKDMARDLRDVEDERDDAIATVGYNLRRLPRPGSAISETDRETMAVIQHALDEEGKRGGDPQQFLKDAFLKSAERYGGGHDAEEIVKDDIERLQSLLKNPPPALSAPEASRESAQKELFQLATADKETISAPAVRVRDQIFTGLNHGDALHKAAETLDISFDQAIRERQGEGFTTSQGRMVDRKEAARIAQAYGAIEEPAHPGGLMSHEIFDEDGEVKPEVMERVLNQSQLGKITIRPDQRPIITLAKNADASTFIHESGHQWLEELMRDSLHEAAPDSLKADAKTTLDWLGVDSPDAIKTKQHEKFARGFEQYMREGVAPSPELAGVFAKFRDWLLRIYQTLKGLGSEITPEIRGVFDRLLASEPQRTVIAPDRAAGPTHGDIWDADAAHTEPHEAEPAMDRVLKETEQYASNLPGNLTNEHATSETKAAEAAAANEPGGQAGVRPNAEGPLEQGSGGPGPQPAGGASGAATGEGLHGGGNAGAEGVAKPAGGERPVEPSNADAGLGDKPLAPRPTDLFGNESPYVDKAGNIKRTTLGSTDDVWKAVKASAERNNGFIGDRQGVVTDQMVLDLAHKIGMDGAEKIVREWVVGKALNAPEMVALGALVDNLGADVHAAMKRATISGLPEDVLAQAEAMARHDLAQAALSGAMAEDARATRAIRLIKRMTGAKTLADIAQGIQETTGKTLFQMRMIAALGTSMTDSAKMSQFMRDSKNYNFGRMILEYWINGLISGPVTHATYAVGNEIMTLQKLGPETLAAAGIGAMRRAMGREGDIVHAGEAWQKLKAHGASMAPATKAFFDAMRTGQAVLLPGGNGAQNLLPFGNSLAERPVYDETATFHDAMASFYGVFRGIKDGMIAGGELAKAAGVPPPFLGVVPSLKGAIPDIYVMGYNVPIGPLARLPAHLVAAIHSFYRGTNFSIEKAGNAYRSAANAGLTGTARDEHMALKINKPSQEEMDQYAFASSETTLMGQGGAFTKALSRLTNHPFFATKDADGKVIPGSGVPLLKFIDPFVTISSNIIQQSIIERTPLGVLSPELRRDLMGHNDSPGSHVVQDTAMARMLVGTAYAIGLGGLAAEGYISGSAPTDPHDAATWTGAGNQAHSVRVGDLWYDVHRLGPLGMLLGISADLYNVSHEASQGDMLLAASHLQHAITQNILDESFMRGPSDLIRAVEDPGRYGEGYIKNFLSSFTPWSVGQAQIARMGDPYSRQARTVMDSIKQKIPGLSESLLPRRDVWGEPIPNKSAFGGLSAIYEQPISHDPVKLAMERLKIPSTPVQRKIGHATLTDEQYDEYSRTAGQFAKHQLDQLVRSQPFAVAPEAVQKDLMERTIRGAHEAAEGIMKGKDRALAIAAQTKPESR